MGPIPCLPPLFQLEKRGLFAKALRLAHRGVSVELKQDLLQHPGEQLFEAMVFGVLPRGAPEGTRPASHDDREVLIGYVIEIGEQVSLSGTSELALSRLVTHLYRLLNEPEPDLVWPVRERQLIASSLRLPTVILHMRPEDGSHRHSLGFRSAHEGIHEVQCALTRLTFDPETLASAEFHGGRRVLAGSSSSHPLCLPEPTGSAFQASMGSMRFSTTKRADRDALAFRDAPALFGVQHASAEQPSPVRRYLETRGGGFDELFEEDLGHTPFVLLGSRFRSWCRRWNFIGMHLGELRRVV